MKIYWPRNGFAESALVPIYACSDFSFREAYLDQNDYNFHAKKDGYELETHGRVLVVQI